ncbi:MAG: undecaprenyl-diphosphate phosphatase [Candidatus Bathyarchaeia archaeon]
MDQLIGIIILGLIQGITEWFPISSSGHLRIAEKIMGLEPPLLFDVTLHVGTLIVVLSFFRSDVKHILSAIIHLDFKSAYGRLIFPLIFGLIPTAILGLILKIIVESLTLLNNLPIAFALLICGAILYSVKFSGEGCEEISIKKALVIGSVQGIAVIPGLSRSGLTLAAALVMGVKREEAFRFTFLLSIPTIIGAFCITLLMDFSALSSTEVTYLEVAAGAMVAMVTGYLSLKTLWKIVKRQRLHFFAFYCWILGLSLIISHFLRIP